MTKIQAAGTPLNPDHLSRMERITQFRTAPGASTTQKVQPSTTPSLETAKTNPLKEKKVIKEKTQSKGLGAKIFAVAAAAFTAFAILNNPGASGSLALQPCPYTKLPNALPLKSMAPFYADCYPQQSLLLGHLTEAQIDTLLNRAEFPEEWAGGFIDKACTQLQTTTQNVTGAVTKLTSVVCNALRLGAAEAEYPAKLTPYATDTNENPWGGWAPLKYFLKGQSPAKNGGLNIHQTTEEELKTLPQPVAEQFVKELTAACDQNQSTYNEKLCTLHQGSTSAMAKPSKAIGKSVYSGSDDPYFTARTQIDFSAGQNQDGQTRITMSSSVRDSHKYEACKSGMKSDAKSSLECINTNDHEHDRFDIDCAINPQEQSISCNIRKIYHAIGHKLAYNVFEKVISPFCSMVTETVTLAEKVITNVTYAANPQNSKPFILSQFTQRVVFEPLRQMTVHASDYVKQVFRTKYPQIVISPNLPKDLPQSCEELALTQK